MDNAQVRVTGAIFHGTYDHDDELDQNSIFASFLRRVKSSKIRLVNRKEADISFKKYLAMVLELAQN